MQQSLSENVKDDLDCFRIVVLPVVPCIFFWLLLPVFCTQIYLVRVNGGMRSHPLPWTVLLIAKTALMICLVINALARLVISLFYNESSANVPLIDHLYPIITTLTTSVQNLDKACFVLYQTWYPLVVIQMFLLCFADSRQPFLIEAKKHLDLGTEISQETRIDIFQNLSPELDSSFLNRLSLWWFTKIQLLGARKTLVIDDLYLLNEGNTTAYLFAKWEKLWDPAIEGWRNLSICENEHFTLLLLDRTLTSSKALVKEPEPPSIVWRLFLMFRFEILSATAIKVLSDVIQLANPFFLNLLLNYILTGNHASMEGMTYVIAMFVCAELRSFLLNYYFYLMMRVGTKIQTTLIAAVYRKTLRLSNSARKTKTVGEIVNLMAIDVESLQFITPYIQQFWSSPFQIILVLIYLFFTIGASAACGVTVMVLFLPVNVITSVIVKKWQIQQMSLKDERMKMCNEILNGIKVIKLYAWEPPMEEAIERNRCKELRLIRKAGLTRGVIDTFNTSSPFFVAMLTFATYTLSNPSHILTPQIAFVSLTLFNQLRSPMAVIAYLMKQAVEAVVANKRIKSFLVADELSPLTIDRITDHSDVGNAVEIKEARLSWNIKELKTILEIDYFTIPKKSLIAVVGRVGSGKSSLLSAILGEMEKVKGYIGVSGQMATVSQQPWIQSATLRENVIFGKQFNRKDYDKIMKACALVKDLTILPNGDATDIGEKGINLSGGQKARVALARAVYQNRDIYLLDDPLSSVDSHVGKHIFENVIGPDGLLRYKTRVLVTNNLVYLHKVDIVAYMQDGKLVAYGPYKKLLEQSESFSKFVEVCKNENEKEKRSSEKGSETEESEESGAEVEDVKQASPDRFDQQISTLRRSSPTGSLSGFSNISINSGKKDEERKSIIDEKVEVGRVTTKQFSLAERLGVYAALGFAEGFCFFAATIFLMISGLRASHNLHAPLLHRLLRSSMLFFDKTPIGRILNRLGKDIDVIDQSLPMSFRFFIYCVENVATILIIIIISTPIFAVTIVPLALFYYTSLHFYVPTSRQIKRLESTNRSPIYQHFEKTVRGLTCIRAFEKVQEFCKSMETYIDSFIRCKYSNTLSNRWLAVRLEFIGNCVVFCAALFAVLSQRWGVAVSAGIAGLSVSYALNITEALNFAVRYISELEMNIVAVERVKEYADASTEAEWRVDQFKPTKDWPSKGQIILKDYSTRYHSKLDLALRHLNATIAPAEKIGIVGRTGAGKSSLALALFRIIEPVSGTVIIDDVDISLIGLHDLRSNLTIIPQDPVLFSGTLRFNLDPSNIYSDQEIWTALELAHLKTFASNLDGLQHRISEGGEDISVGQRQLICLTRALLRKSKVLVLDEATAAVDLETDSLIQETIRREFNTSTVLTIAHRLHTVIDYDRIIVLENGSIREFDSPKNLLANRSSIFFSMAYDAHIVR
uniref:ABC-type glutathione-S-conjugate transporter n=1 Tax=Elaeophora elaphi TaxID=1147741 RepID=A0A0R3RUJ2_9BILA